MFVRSPRPASPPIGSSSFATGRLSPVSAASAGLQGRRSIDPRVGGDRVAFLDKDDVTGHELGRRNAGALAIANHSRVRGRHLSQGRYADSARDS